VQSKNKHVIAKLLFEKNTTCMSLSCATLLRKSFPTTSLYLSFVSYTFHMVCMSMSLPAFCQ